MRADNYVMDDPVASDPAPAPAPTTTTTTTTTTGTGGAVASAPVVGSVAAGGVNIGGVRATVAVADTPVQATPVLRVMPGDRVFIRPLPGNTKPVQVGQYSLAAKFGPFDYVAPGDTEREYPVDSTGRIWICQPATAFVAGEGIAVNIRRAQ